MIRTATVALALVALTSCTSQTNTTAGNNAPSPMTTAMQAPPAGGSHLTMTGAVNVSTDVAVRQCTTAKPGTSLLSGYVTVFRSPDGTVSGTIGVHKYLKDGTYTIAPGAGLFSSDMIVNVKRGGKLQHGTSLMAKADGHPSLVVTVSDHGMKGRADFKNWFSLYGEKTGDKGGLVSGTVTWICDSVKPMPF